MVGLLFPCLAYTLCRMDMLLFFLPSSSCLFPSATPNQSSFHKTHLLSYHLCIYFYGASIVGAQRSRNKVKNSRQVSACARALVKQNQFTQTDIRKHKRSNAFIWKETIRGYVKNGFWDKALRAYYQMQRAGINPDQSVFLSVIKACGNLSDLQAGMKIHEDIIARGFESDVFVGTALASMYVKCGSLENARQVFERIPEQNVVSWTSIIASYSQNGHPHAALAFFNEMQAQGIKPNSITIVSVLPACADLLALEQGKQIHGYAIRSGFDYEVVVVNGLVNMYSKCGKVNIARKLFETMPERDIVSGTAIIAAYAQNGHLHEALAFFTELQVQGIKPDSFAIVSFLAACTHLLALEQGKQIHGYAIRSGFDSDVVDSELLDMYAKCGNVNMANKLFERMSDRDVMSWTAIIAAYS